MPTKRFVVTGFLIFLLMFIHAIDMLLTEYYIGNKWQYEAFPPMSMCIRLFDIYVALWLSRITMYTYFFMALVNCEKTYWFYFLICITILYWTAMTPWLFQLGLATWPFPRILHIY